MPGPTVPVPKFPTSVTRASLAWGAGNFAWNVYKLLTKRPPEVKTQDTPWRPPQWSGQYPDIPIPVVITDYRGDMYVFDAVFKLEHTTSLRTTDHPIQTGANVVDHSYQLPERLMCEIGMSDAMDAYYQDQWQEYSAKSVSAYKKLKEIQYSRMPLTIDTRLNTYRNMVIEHMHAPDDFKTVYGLRCVITLKQLITAQVKATKVSVRPHASNKTSGGVKQAKPPVGSALSEMGF